tara:strand:+ start:48 stop:368 length:321 start_codon:yes stop_codon:yes gene_type:complete
MSTSPIKFTKSAVNKLIQLQNAAKVPPAALLCIEVDGLNPEKELIYEFLYKKDLKKGEKVYKSNGFPYILADHSAFMINNATIDYCAGHFEIDLNNDLHYTTVGEA